MRSIDLKRFRKELGLKQKELADKLEVERSLISKIESGKRTISKELEMKIIDRLHLDGGRASVEAKIDFLRIRFKTLDIQTIIEKLLHMDMNWFTHEERGFYHYTETFSYGSIRLFRNPEDMNMGIMLDLSGEGCRQLEDIFEEDNNRSWTEFFRSLYDDDIFGKNIIVDTKITRIDIALDELIVEGKPNFNLYKLKEKMEQGLVSTTFKNFDFNGGFSFEKNKLVNKGLSLYFGSRQSPLYFNFYQKDYELARKEGLSVEEAREKHEIKNRYEIRLSDEKAFLFVEYFLSSGESLDWLVKEIVNASLTVFDIEDGTKVYCKEWYDVIDKLEGLRLSVHAEKPSIEKTLRWLSNYLAPSLKMIKLIDLRLGTNELMERIDFAELKEKHEELIDQVCVSAKDLLFTTDQNSEVRNYMEQEFNLEEEYPF
ncbi:XRE family transcriptional regulator [Enterococcus faecium]|uniref:XRE family transcriptional regulator n=1 Tax=Enterococcus faecium TaxID=1352 RepID=UPI000F4E5E09|nr:XRE family transcriptional regulator [Enterococcus faecium]ROX63920.1 XRE family transcriptional regulator [Enterococcus faecium]ROX65852.1 XRE family transcriptional regulator [Enterococcus faecium]ROY25598.1 XRE family transcriptional regulator [Enterococcus faecium]ROY60372.1 XRE family transcriptional regulator [Enterococcus faecium]ROY76941.1 XRE family transcriptional regulator [Enterococcus faecium]